MSLIYKNEDSVFSKNRMSYFENLQKQPTPDFGLLVKVSDGKGDNSTLVNSFFDHAWTSLYYFGVADKIRWVPEFIDAVSGEIGRFERAERRVVGFWKFIQSGVEKIKVGGWAWEYFWGIGASILSKNCVSPAKIK